MSQIPSILFLSVPCSYWGHSFIWTEFILHACKVSQPCSELFVNFNTLFELQSQNRCKLQWGRWLFVTDCCKWFCLAL
uniref:Uncharacterized protein n=1 Tax=Anguilla anguilla TaxID=7936 RepID=A0A0E9WWM1_ANGAN